jgi:hypothetical protein
MSCPNCQTFNDQRFEYETTDLLNLSPRDSSLHAVGMVWGATYALQKVASDAKSLEAQVASLLDANEFAEMVILKLRGVTPRGWAKGGESFNG